MILETIKSGVIEEATRRFAKPNSLFQCFLLWCISGAIHERRSRHVRNITEKVIHRIYSGSKHRDFIWSLLKHRESVWSFLKQRRNSKDMSDNEIAMNTAHFIVKGSETTATALCGLTNHILRSPFIYKRLIDEIRGACESETDVNHTVLKDLPYLNACIEEGLRIFPPIPIGLLRTVPKGGALINGHAVPGGTSVSVASWATAHSPDSFADPGSFIPERYLDTSGYGNDVKAAAQPFSRGVRGCLGRNLAYAELRLILGSLLWHFDVDFSDTAESWNPKNQFEGLRVYNTWEKKPLMVQLTDVRLTDVKKTHT
jgi:cytochrome P450